MPVGTDDSKKYVDAVLSKLPKDNLHLNTEIVSVTSRDDGVDLVEAGGARHVYDHVILAWVCNPETTPLTAARTRIRHCRYFEKVER